MLRHPMIASCCTPACELSSAPSGTPPSDTARRRRPSPSACRVRLRPAPSCCGIAATSSRRWAVPCAALPASLAAEAQHRPFARCRPSLGPPGSAAAATARFKSGSRSGLCSGLVLGLRLEVKLRVGIRAQASTSMLRSSDRGPAKEHSDHRIGRVYAWL